MMSRRTRRPRAAPAQRKELHRCGGWPPAPPLAKEQTPQRRRAVLQLSCPSSGLIERCEQDRGDGRLLVPESSTGKTQVHQNHFPPKRAVYENLLSSKNSFIKIQFRPSGHFHQKTTSSKFIFIKNHSHQKTFSPRTIFIQNQIDYVGKRNRTKRKTIGVSETEKSAFL